MRVWDASVGKCINILRGHKNWIGCVSVSPDGKGIASGSSDRTIRVFLTNNPIDIVASKETQDDAVCCLKGHLGNVTDVVWSPVGRARICSSSTDWSVRVWNLENVSCTHVLDLHKGTVSSVSWSFDGKKIVSGSRDGTVRLWRVYKRKHVCLEILQGHDAPVSTVAWSSDNTMVVSSALDTTLGIGGGKEGDEAGTTSVIVWQASPPVPADETAVVGIENGEDCSLVVASGSSLSRRFRADFIHAKNNAPQEMIGDGDAVIGFSVVPNGKTIMNVCSINPRRAYCLNEDSTVLHILARIGGGGACSDCAYGVISIS